MIEIIQFTVRAGWIAAFLLVLWSLDSKLYLKKMGEVKERCTERVSFNIVEWHKYAGVYHAIYSFTYNNMDMSIEGSVKRTDKEVEFTQLMVNPDNLTEIFEPDFDFNCREIKTNLILGIIIAIITIPISLYYLEIR